MKIKACAAAVLLSVNISYAGGGALVSLKASAAPAAPAAVSAARPAAGGRQTRESSAVYMSAERTAKGYVLAELDVQKHLVPDGAGRACRESAVDLMLYSDNYTSMHLKFKTVTSNDTKSVFELAGVGMYTQGVENAQLVIGGAFHKSICLTSDVYEPLGKYPLTAVLTIQQNGKVSIIPLTFPRPE